MLAAGRYAALMSSLTEDRFVPFSSKEKGKEK